MKKFPKKIFLLLIFSYSNLFSYIDNKLQVDSLAYKQLERMNLQGKNIIKTKEKQLEELEDFINDEEKDYRFKLNKVNFFFNQFNYVNDIDYFNKKDYWVSPHTFNLLRKGDCEDFAVAKMFFLKKNNFNGKMKLLYTHNSDNIAHIILLVETENKDDFYVLDNIYKRVHLFSKSYYIKKKNIEISLKSYFPKYLSYLSEEEKAVILSN